MTPARRTDRAPSPAPRRTDWLWVMAALALGPACGKASDPPVRLELGSVAPHEAGPVALSIPGQPLPDGARGLITLDGIWLEALAVPVRGRRSFPCSVSPHGELVVAREALGEPALPLVFEGALEVELTDPAGRASLGGPQPTQFVLEGESQFAKRRVELARRMQDARDALGVRVEPSQHGLVVRALVAGGELARAGVRPGDVLTRLGPVPLLADSALVLPETGPVPPLTLRRGEEELRVSPSLGAQRGRIRPESAWWIVGLFTACGLLLPGRRRAPRSGRGLALAILTSALLACAVALRAPLTALLPVLAVELLALRRAGSRAEALRHLADTATSALALSASVLALRASEAGERLPALFCAPGLWLALLALTRTLPHAPRGQRLARNGAAAATWGLAAASGTEANGWLPTAAAVTFALLALELDPTSLGARLGTWERSLLAGLSVGLGVLTPWLGALEPALNVACSALAGVALGVVLRAGQRSIARAPVASPPEGGALYETAR